jgi:outer membrane receptor protein involved in Fe transport
LLVASAQLGAQQPDTLRADTVRARRDTTRVSRLAPVRVTGTRLSPTADANVPARVDVVDVRRAPPGPAATAELMAGLPGMSTFDDQGTRVQPTLDLRGYSLSPVVGSPQGVSVFLDGVRINEPDAQELDFDLVPMDAVEHAELVRGPAAVFGKNSLAGALILSTARGGATPGVETAAEAGAFGYRGARVTASGVTHGIDGYLLARGSDEDGYRVDTPARTRMLFATVGRKRDDSDVALSVLAAHDRVFQAGSLPESWLGEDTRANYTVGDYFAPDLAHIALRGDRRLGRGQLRGNVFARRNDREQFNVNVSAPSVLASVLNRSLGGAAEATFPVRLGPWPLTVTAGAELGRNDVRYRIFQQATPDGPVDADCDQATGLCENARAGEDNAALYAQAQIALGRSVVLTASARGDYVRIPFRDLTAPENDGTSTFRRVSPLLGATYRPGTTLRAYVSLSSGFRAPAALELACADPDAPCPLPFALGEDPPLRPVTVWNSEAGAEWEPVRAVSLHLVGFRAEGHDEIVFVSSERAAGFFKNIARTRRQGVEVSGTAALPAGLRVSTSYAFIDATYQTAAQLASAIPDAPPVSPGDRFPLIPAHRLTARLAMTRLLKSYVLDGDLSARALSTQFLRGDEANRQPPVPGYTVTALRLGVSHERGTVTLQVDNLLDARYETFGVYGLNPLGPPGGPAPESPTLERFLTPGYPRSVTVRAAIRFF